MDEAFRLKDEMLTKGYISGVVAYNDLIYEFCKTWKAQQATLLLKEMKVGSVFAKDCTYDALIQGHCVENNVSKVLELLHEMSRQGFTPCISTCKKLIRGLCFKGRLQ